MTNLWTRAKAVIAHTTETGQSRYALFERLACTPDEPDGKWAWQAIFYGTLEEAVAHIFWIACVTEHELVDYYSMLDSEGNVVGPEVYIDGWMKALASPLPLDQAFVEVRKKDFSGIPEYAAPALDAVAVLGKHGLHDKAEQLEKGETVFLYLEDHSQALDELYPQAEKPEWKTQGAHYLHAANKQLFDGLYPSRLRNSNRWRIIIQLEPLLDGPTAEPELAYTSESHTQQPVPLPKLLKTYDESGQGEPGYFVESANGSWRYFPNSYETLAWFIRELSSGGLLDPSTYSTQVRQFREALLQASEGELATMALHIELDAASGAAVQLGEMEDRFSVASCGQTAIVKAKDGVKGMNFVERLNILQLQDGGATWYRKGA